MCVQFCWFTWTDRPARHTQLLSTMARKRLCSPLFTTTLDRLFIAIISARKNRWFHDNNIITYLGSLWQKQFIFPEFHIFCHFFQYLLTSGVSKCQIWQGGLKWAHIFNKKERLQMSIDAAHFYCNFSKLDMHFFPIQIPPCSQKAFAYSRNTISWQNNK